MTNFSRMFVQSIVISVLSTWFIAVMDGDIGLQHPDRNALD